MNYISCLIAPYLNRKLTWLMGLVFKNVLNRRVFDSEKDQLFLKVKKWRMMKVMGKNKVYISDLLYQVAKIIKIFDELFMMNHVGAKF